MKKVWFVVLSCVLAAGMVLGLSACSVDITLKEGSDPIHFDLGEFNPKDLNLESISGLIGDSGELEDMMEQYMASSGESSEQEAPFATGEDSIINEVPAGNEDGITQDNPVEDLEEWLANLEEGFNDSMGTWLEDMEGLTGEIEDLPEDLDAITEINEEESLVEDIETSIEDALKEIEEKFSDFMESEEAEGGFEIADEFKAAEDLLEEGEIEQYLEKLKEFLDEAGLGKYYDKLAEQFRKDPDSISYFFDSDEDGNLFSYFFQSSGFEAPDDLEAAPEEEATVEDEGIGSAFGMKEKN